MTPNRRRPTRPTAARGRAKAAAAAVVLVLLAACSSGGGGGGGAGPTGAAGAAGEGGGTARETPTTQPDPERLHFTEGWTWTAPGGASAGVPASDGKEVAVTAGHQWLFLFDAKGAVRWQANRLQLRDVAPTLTADLVLAATKDGVVAYDRATGKQKWEAVLGQQANTPAIAGGRATVSTWQGTLFGLDLADGRVAWKSALGGPSIGPAAAGGGAAVASWDTGHAAGVVAVDLATGRQKWSVAVPYEGVSAPAVTPDGLVVLVAGDIAAHGLSLADGSERWRRRMEGAGSPEVQPLPLADGTVVVGHRQGGFLVLRTSDGGQLWGAGSDGAAVLGSPAGPGPNGWFALPLDDGRVMFSAKGHQPEFRLPSSPALGVVLGPDGLMVMSTNKGDQNGLKAARGW